MVDLSITNEQLRVADREIHDHNRFFNIAATYGDQTFSNPYAYRMVSERIKQLKGDIGRIEAGSEFDVLVRSHMLSTLDKQQICLEYFFNENSQYRIEDVVDAMRGTGAYKLLEETVAGINYEKHFTYHMKNSEIALLKIRCDREDVYNKIVKMIPRMKEVVLEYYKAVGFIPEECDINIVPTPSQGGRSNWRSELNLVELDVHSFESLGCNDNIEIWPAFAYMVMFHELGHASHFIYSKEMPECLQMKGFNSVSGAAKSVSEGVADDRERIAMRFMEENVTRFCVPVINMSLTSDSESTSLEREAVPIFYSLAKAKEIDAKKFGDLFDIRDYIKSINPANYGAYRDTSS
ncbi:MAG: hypothetical protein V1870_05480, partial [Candidatus Aenigmatarchaeota archaeon]